MLDHAYLTILASAGCPSVKIGHHMPLQLATCRLYPCAHCIITGAAASAIAAILGTDISNDAGRDALLHDPARLQRRGFGSPHLYLCGFHWRFSTVVGRDMGWKIGAFIVQKRLKPLKLANN